jgi:serine protease Do
VEAEKDEDLGAFQRLVAGVAPGQEIDLALVREGAARKARIVIGTQPKIDPNKVETELGFHVQEITANLAREQRLDSTKGAFVVFVGRGSPAREAGLRVGDVIVRIEEAPVQDLEDFRQAIDVAAKATRFLVTARRGEEMKFLLLKPGAKGSEEEIEEEPGEVDLQP